MHSAKLTNAAKWLGPASGLLFLAISLYLRLNNQRDSTQAMPLILCAIAASLLALGFGLVSLRRWQSMVALGIFIYSVYWFFTAPLNVIQ